MRGLNRTSGLRDCRRPAERGAPYPRRRGVPPPGGGGKRGIRHRMVSYPPLNSPSSSLGRDSLRSRVKKRGAHRCVWCSKASFLMEAEPVQVALSKFRAAQHPMSETTHGTEPPFPPFRRECFAERLEEGFGGVKRGKGNHTVPFSPFAPVGGRRQSPAAGRRQGSQPSLWKKS